MNGDVQIIVVCPQSCMDNALFNIRKWHFNDPLAKSCVRHVHRASTLAEALLFVGASAKQSIVVTTGFSPSEILEQTSIPALTDLEVVNCPLRQNASEPDLDEPPSASLLESHRFLNTKDPLPALRKSLLRRKIQETVAVRELRIQEEFQQYFSLRYRVWKQMNYLPTEQDCEESEREVNFTDRTAYPLGAFTSDGTLVGCARLVFTLGRDSQHLKLIEKCVADTGDSKLIQVFKYPARLSHPFDLLESFQGFGDYFKRLVRERVSYAEVSRVIVAPEQRLQGLGEVLVDSLVSLARKKRVKVLFLACHGRLRPFYEQCGFKVLPGLQCDSFAGVNAPAIVMTQELRPCGNRVVC